MEERRFIVAGEDLPAWPNPISHAVVAGDTCFVSGQLSVNRAGVYVSGTPEEEALRAFHNLFAVLKAAGFMREELVFVDVAFLDLADLGTVDQLYREFFREGRRPARTVYQVAALPFGAKLKVMGTAVKTLRPFATS